MGVTVREKPKGSGVWWVFINHRGARKAKRVGVGPKGKRLAGDVAVKIQARLLEGDQSIFTARARVSAPPRQLTFETLAKRWLDWYPAIHALRPGTIENHQKAIRAHLIPFFGTVAVSTITRRNVQEFIASKRAPGGSRRAGKALSDSTIRARLPTLKLILDYAVEERLLATNPMVGGPKLWRPSQTPERVDPFTGRELRDLLRSAAAIDPDLEVFFRLWAQAGLRSGEVRALWRGDLDLEAGLVHVQRTRTGGLVGPTKTGRARMTSFLHPICEDVDDWRPAATPESRSLLSRLRTLGITSLAPDSYLFGRPLDERWLHRVWRQIVTKASVRYREPEQLRHTFASTLLSRNAPLLYVAQQGGWKNPGVLLTFYARWMPQTAQLAVQPGATPAQPRSKEIELKPRRI